jgi:hypothetical protein
MIASLQDAVGGNTVALTAIRPDFEPTSNVLRVAIDAISQPGGNLLERVLATTDSAQSNTVLRKAYLNGGEQDQPIPSNGANRFDQPLIKIPRGWVFTTAGAVRRRITDQRTLLGSSRFVAGGGGGGGGGQSPAGAGAQGTSGGTRERGQDATPAGADFTPNAVVIGREFSVRNSIRGIKGTATTFGVVEVLSVIDLEFIAPIASGGGSGGGRPHDGS